MRRATPLLILLALLVLLPACYERTVATKGLGGSGVRTQQPYRSETAADRAVDSMIGRQTKHMTRYDEIHYDEKP
jgi:hypothetical protein